LRTLMLKSFPRRTNIFCTQALRSTFLSDTFAVLFWQHRRWINSITRHAARSAELVLVGDLCARCCFSAVGM
ncbi:chitin synthase-domain-containing protein, partial [Mycena olivaceomarginata]